MSVIACLHQSCRAIIRRMSKLRALPFFIATLTVCVFGGPAHCQSRSDSPKWQLKKLAFEVSDEFLHNDIYVMDVSGSKPRRLVEGISPAWSPDGQKIAYGKRDAGRFGQIHVISADGSARRQLTRVKDGACFPDWSPDGEKIAYTAGLGSKSYTIWVISKDGENAKSITEGLGARWSPDGTRLAFLRNPKKPGEKGTIWVVNSDGTGERMVVLESPAWELAWYPDGKSIAFASKRDGKWAIFRVNLDGTGLTRIASDERASVFSPLFSPDGLQLLADGFPVRKSSEVPTSLMEAGAGNGTILLIDLTGHPTKVLAHGIHPSAVWAHE